MNGKEDVGKSSLLNSLFVLYVSVEVGVLKEFFLQIWKGLLM